jgi:hypothetical protein
LLWGPTPNWADENVGQIAQFHLIWREKTVALPISVSWIFTQAKERNSETIMGYIPCCMQVQFGGFGGEPVLQPKAMEGALSPPQAAVRESG